MTTRLSAPLPDVTPEESTILFIDTGDASALITQVVIHVQQTVPDLPVKIDLIPPLLSHLPSGGNESPGLTR